MKQWIALAGMVVVVSSLTAGPFGRRGVKVPNQYAASAQTDAGNELWSAQGVANRIARTGVFRHHGNPTGGYEGIGMGATPEAARASCCYASRFVARDVGYARMSNGMWCACQRY